MQLLLSNLTTYKVTTWKQVSQAHPTFFLFHISVSFGLQTHQQGAVLQWCLQGCLQLWAWLHCLQLPGHCLCCCFQPLLLLLLQLLKLVPQMDCCSLPGVPGMWWRPPSGLVGPRTWQVLDLGPAEASWRVEGVGWWTGEVACPESWIQGCWDGRCHQCTADWLLPVAEMRKVLHLEIHDELNSAKPYTLQHSLMNMQRSYFNSLSMADPTYDVQEHRKELWPLPHSWRPTKNSSIPYLVPLIPMNPGRPEIRQRHQHCLILYGLVHFCSCQVFRQGGLASHEQEPMPVGAQLNSSRQPEHISCSAAVIMESERPQCYSWKTSWHVQLPSEMSNGAQARLGLLDWSLPPLHQLGRAGQNIHRQHVILLWDYQG